MYRKISSTGVFRFSSVLKKSLKLLVFILLFSPSGARAGDYPVKGRIPGTPDESKQRETLELILKVLPPDQLNEDSSFDVRGRISFTDRTFVDWLERTGELPPDFDRMPSLPFLPDPIVIDEGLRNIPVETPEQWQEKREWLKEQLQHYITGTFPPAPDNLEAEILHERMDGDVLLRLVELSFGPERRKNFL